MVSNINTGLVKDRVSYALHNVKEIIIMQMRQKRESVNEAEMETLLNPETTEEWRHDIRTAHNTWQHEHTTVYTENNKHRRSMTTDINIKAMAHGCGSPGS